MKSREENFPISNYPLEQTEFFYAQKQVRDKLENEQNKVFDYSMFHDRKDIIKIKSNQTGFIPKNFLK